MAKQRAVGLGHLRAPPLALGRVRLGERDGDDPIVVAGDHLGPRGRRVGQELEHEPVLRVLGLGLQAQLPAQEAVEEAVLGQLEVAPGFKVPRRRRVRDRVVVPAGEAEGVIGAGRGQPVAGVLPSVGAEEARRAFAGKRRPVRIAHRLERREGLQFRQVAERVSAPAAGPVLEIDDVVSSLASEQLHLAPALFLAAGDAEDGCWFRVGDPTSTRTASNPRRRPSPYSPRRWDGDGRRPHSRRECAWGSSGRGQRRRSRSRRRNRRGESIR